jgi:hypothetical protein
MVSPDNCQKKTNTEKRKIPRFVKAAAWFLFLYFHSYLILSLLGSYTLPRSEASDSPLSPSQQWQPKFITWHDEYNKNENKTSIKANLLGYFYSPLVILDQKLVHKSKLTSESWVSFLFDAFIKNKKYGYINTSGEMVIEPQYRRADDFSEGLAAVTIDGLYGYIDKTGKVIIEPQFDYAGNFSEGLASVRDANDLYGYINKSGSYVIEPKFKDAWAFQQECAIVKDASGKFGQIDRSGKYIIEPEDDSFPRFSEGLRCKQVDGKYGYFDKSGNIVIEPQFSYARNFSEGLAFACIFEPNTVDQTQWALFPAGPAPFADHPLNVGFIDKTGKAVIDFQFDDAGSFSEGFAAVKKDGKWGYIDKSGNIIIEPRFSIARPFSEGLAAVCLEGKQGYIDKSGKFVISPKFSVALSFSEGLAPVALEIGNR